MELGVLGLEGFHASENAASSLSLDGESLKQKWSASGRSGGGFKMDGSGLFCDDDGDWRSSKVSKNAGNYSPSSDVNMLSFSSSSSKSDSSTLPYFPQTAAGVLPKNTGYYSGALNTSGCMYLMNGVRGPFTPSQWLELEQQALIYKYMTANEPIPVQLLIPIKKALESAGLFAFNGGGTLRPTAWGWSPYPLGYPNSTDPEPGRCRRTDGKKWRCARDAVLDQKYCDRHINRGRHRSRKHVEGQANGHSVSRPTKSTTTATKHTPPSVVAAASSALVAPGAGLSNSFDMNQQYHQAKSLQQSASNPAMNPLLDRMPVNRENGSQGLQDASQLSLLTLSGSNANLNYSESAFSVPKHRGSNEELFTNTTSQKNSQFCSGNGTSTHTLNGTDGSGIIWPGLQLQSDTTQQQLSTSSIPMGFAVFMSSQQLEMGLGVGAQSHDNRQASWIPSSWEPTMGGPLGEALQSNSGAHGEGQKTSAFNVLPKGWDGMGSCQLSSSSPTGVLQRSALVSLSNSSAGSSPRADNSKTIESGGSLCNDLKRAME